MDKKPWLAALLNFFFWGLGTLYVGRRTGVGALLFLTSIWATYVENFLVGSASPHFWPLFSVFFLIGVATAIDGYQDAQSAGRVR